jgi:CheY-like chemotaxis protein
MPAESGLRAGLRVLLVDDGKAERRLARLALEKAGCHITTADDARSALRALDGNAFDLLICDQRLPDLIGTALIALIAQTVSPPPPMILLSAEVSARTRDAAARAGAAAVIGKPAAPAQLEELVRRHAAIPMAHHHDQLLDANHAGDFLLGAPDPAGRQRLAQRWQQAAREQITHLAGHVSTMDARAWRQELHRLRGTAALVGAIRLEVAAAALESAIPATGSLDLLESLVEATAVALHAHAALPV